MAQYTVQPGDCLSSITARFGFPNVRVIYDHPNNAAFKASRPDPNIICPGDVIFIPDKRDKTVPLATGAAHRFVVKSPRARFRARIQLGAPFTYQLDLEGSTFEGKLEDATVIDVPIAPDASRGLLRVWPNHDKARDPLQFDLLLGGLDPIEETTGVQARLNNLGFECGEVDGALGPRTERAVEAFQRMAGLKESGKIDDATRDALQARHDSDQAWDRQPVDAS